jgi:hypothetical protein
VHTAYFPVYLGLQHITEKTSNKLKRKRTTSRKQTPQIHLPPSHKCIHTDNDNNDIQHHEIAEAKNGKDREDTELWKLFDDWDWDAILPYLHAVIM